MAIFSHLRNEEVVEKFLCDIQKEGFNFLRFNIFC